MSQLQLKILETHTFLSFANNTFNFYVYTFLWKCFLIFLVHFYFHSILLIFPLYNPEIFRDYYSQNNHYKISLFLFMGIWFDLDIYTIIMIKPFKPLITPVFSLKIPQNWSEWPKFHSALTHYDTMILLSTKLSLRYVFQVSLQINPS